MAKNPKRPKDPNKLGKLIVDLATGEAVEPKPSENKNPAAVNLGSLGGAARAKKLSKAQRTEIAKKAAAKRWEKDE